MQTRLISNIKTSPGVQIKRRKERNNQHSLNLHIYVGTAMCNKNKMFITYLYGHHIDNIAVQSLQNNIYIDY